MNYHSDKWIMNRVMEHYKDAKKIVPEEQIVGIFYQGSGNYGLDSEDSDVDTKLIVVPSLREVALNRPAVSTTHVRANNEHIDIKDVRVMLQTFKKQNINFLEVLFTSYAYVLPKFDKIWKILVDRREDIARYNPKKFYKTMAGMSKAKFEALEHPYPSRAHLIEQYGYDGKQLCHLIRFNGFLHDYIDGRTFKDCLTNNNAEYLKLVKNQIYSLHEARYWANYVYQNTDIVCSNLIHSDTCPEPNAEVDKLLEEMQYEFLKTQFKSEMEEQ